MSEYRSIPESLNSRLLPDLLDQVQQVSPLTILDVGYAVPETVTYFSDRRCRLHFAGLHEVLLPGAGDAEESWQSRFRRVMDYPRGTHFDLCLFWDFFSYLDDEALQAFTETLAPFIDRHSLAHGFALLNRGVDVPHQQYGIVDRDHFQSRPRPGPAPISHARPQARLANLLTGFAVRHSVLHRDGSLEMALAADA